VLAIPTVLTFASGKTSVVMTAGRVGQAGIDPGSPVRLCWYGDLPSVDAQSMASTARLRGRPRGSGDGMSRCFSLFDDHWFRISVVASRRSRRLGAAELFRRRCASAERCRSRSF
jgi:hypothetical protein